MLIRVEERGYFGFEYDLDAWHRVVYVLTEERAFVIENIILIRVWFPGILEHSLRFDDLITLELAKAHSKLLSLV